ncbi:hypothetical protein B296_00051786 [Ensete ventricosum]|uniref:Uncharacterized protein n=1 Tax=Ensete ventricosum TaxID=4639 RepID=A0A426YF53_ENSVE|nr:hypothetical protein B296_00051786 [Ensete ventricosum]
MPRSEAAMGLVIRASNLFYDGRSCVTWSIRTRGVDDGMYHPNQRLDLMGEIEEGLDRNCRGWGIGDSGGVRPGSLNNRQYRLVVSVGSPAFVGTA